MVVRERLIEAVELMKQKQEKGMKLFYLETYTYVYQHIVLATKKKQDAILLMKVCYAQVYNNIETWQNTDIVYSCLSKVIYKNILKKHRIVCSQKHEEHMADNVINPITGDISIDDSSEGRAAANILKNMIEQLSIVQRIIVVAYYYDKMAMEEIAELIGCSVQDIKMHLFEAEQTLTTMIAKHEQTYQYKLHEITPSIMYTAILELFAKKDYKMNWGEAFDIYKEILKENDIERDVKSVEPAILEKKNTFQKIRKRVVTACILLGIGYAAFSAYNKYQQIVVGDGTAYEYAEDKGIYSIRDGNIMNDNTIRVAENGDVYVYFSKYRDIGIANIYVNYTGNVTTGKSIYWEQKELSNEINVGNITYAMETNSSKGGEDNRYISFNWDTGKISGAAQEVEGIRIDKGTERIQANGIWYMNTENSFVRFDPVTGEETMLFSAPLMHYFIDNDRIYFANPKDENKLYSMTIQGEALTKLSDFSSYKSFMYQGRIYYSTQTIAGRVLMSMNPDGTNHQSHCILNNEIGGYYDGRVYYVLESKEDAKIVYIDLDGESYEEKIVAIDTAVKELLDERFSAAIEDTVYNETDTTERIFLNEIDAFVVGDGYMMFQYGYSANGKIYKETFLYNIETEELKLLIKEFNIR